MDEDLTSLISDLADISAILNRESDSINKLIEGFENTLRQLNIGLEVWCSEPIDSVLFNPAGNDGKQEPSLFAVCLGFARHAKDWHLCLRNVTSQEGKPQTTFGASVTNQNGTWLLRDSSRNYRIAAIRQFPTLLTNMKAEAQGALQAIQDTKKFVGLA